MLVAVYSEQCAEGLQYVSLFMRDEKTESVADGELQEAGEGRGHAEPGDICFFRALEEVQEGFLLLDECGKCRGGVGVRGRTMTGRRFHSAAQSPVLPRFHEIRKIVPEPAAAKCTSCMPLLLFTFGNSGFETGNIRLSVSVEMIQALHRTPFTGSGFLLQYGNRL